MCGTTLITLTALPLSLAAALLALWALGLSINVMTLGGLAVAIGVLVDDAIIDVENVYRRLKENGGGAGRGAPGIRGGDPGSEQRDPPVDGVRDGDHRDRVRAAALPAGAGGGGSSGRWGSRTSCRSWRRCWWALTVTPALCRYLLGARLSRGGGHGEGEHGEGGFLVRWLKRRYEPALRWSIRRRGVVLTAAGLTTVVAVLMGRTFGTSFLPEFNEGDVHGVPHGAPGDVA